MLRTALLLATFATSAMAEVTVTDARVVAAFANAKAAAVYAKVESDLPDVLIGAHSLASMTALHRSVEDGGIMKMEPAGEVPIAPDAPVILQSGDLHVMLMGLSPEMLGGQTLPVTLIFRDAGEISFDATVQIGPEAEDGDQGEGATE